MTTNDLMKQEIEQMCDTMFADPDSIELLSPDDVCSVAYNKLYERTVGAASRLMNIHCTADIVDAGLLLKGLLYIMFELGWRAGRLQGMADMTGSE